jgi:uncharacterized DUF497 family protein
MSQHGLDFADAHLVYENPEKVTFDVRRKGEDRVQDIAMVELNESVLTLVYVLRGSWVRCISFRAASRKERKAYAEHNQGKS